MQIKAVGFCGPQRVGKTTSAKHCSLEEQIPYIEVSASSVLAEHGCDAKTHYGIKERLFLQKQILLSFTETWREALRRGPFVTDRTPLDILAYTMCDVLRDFPLDLELEYYDLINTCLSVHREIFSHTVHVQPGINLVEDQKSAPACLAYMEHFNAALLGACAYYELKCFVMPRIVLSVEDRHRHIALAFRWE